MNRRGFLRNILIEGVAPVFIPSTRLMKLWIPPSEKLQWIASIDGYDLDNVPIPKEISYALALALHRAASTPSFALRHPSFRVETALRDLGWIQSFPDSPLKVNGLGGGSDLALTNGLAEDIVKQP